MEEISEVRRNSGENLLGAVKSKPPNDPTARRAPSNLSEILGVAQTRSAVSRREGNVSQKSRNDQISRAVASLLTSSASARDGSDDSEISAEVKVNIIHGADLNLQGGSAITQTAKVGGAAGGVVKGEHSDSQTPRNAENPSQSQKAAASAGDVGYEGVSEPVLSNSRHGHTTHQNDSGIVHTVETGAAARGLAGLAAAHSKRKDPPTLRAPQTATSMPPDNNEDPWALGLMLGEYGNNSVGSRFSDILRKTGAGIPVNAAASHSGPNILDPFRSNKDPQPVTSELRQSDGLGDITLSTRAAIAAAGVASASRAAASDPFRDPPPPEPQQPAASPTPRVPFYKKRWFIISQLILVPLGIVLLFIILFPVIRAIVQSVVNKSQIGVDSASISQAQNGSFLLGLLGTVTHTGIFSARIHFQESVDVAWVEDNDEKTVTHLGSMTIDTLFARGKRAPLNTTGPFQIAGDGTDFGRFVAYMITAQNFTWRLTSNNLRVQALKFPEAKGIKFNKDVTLAGLNNFDNNIVLKDFQLPSDNPTGGINFVAVTELNNPSPFSLDLGTVVFALSYQGVSLGMGSSPNTQLVNGTNSITLSGTLQPHTSSSDLVVVSQLFTNYLNSNVSEVVATGVSTLQPDNSSVSWLSHGLESLHLTIPFTPPSSIDPIRTITIGELSLGFTPNTPWAPRASSNSVQASLELPFGFKLDIGEIQNDFNITKDGNAIAGLSTPLGASTSSVSVLSSTDTVGTINITINNSNLNVTDSEHPMFSAFNANLTSMNVVDFRLIGRSRTVANTSLGQITLDPILVNVSTSLNGLQGLKGMTEIKTVDVQGGTEDAITLAIDVSIFNPSNLNLNIGDLTLQLLRDGAILGTALLPNLTLNMGNNTARAKSSFEANKTPQGLQTLNEFIGKKDVQLSIAGFNGSTGIASLVEAFETLDIDVTLPGLMSNLLDTAALKVLPTTGRQDNISHVTVRLANPFSAGLHITKISSTVKSSGIALGSIDTTTDFMAAPKSTTTSPDLDLDMNFDPASLFTVTRALAVEAGLDVSPLDGIVQIGDINYLSITGPPISTQHQASAFRGFDLPSFVQSAFKKLQSDVELSTDVTIGDYKTTIQYTQSGVPTATDDSLNFILPVLAQPIVQKIITGSALGIDTVLITNPQQNSFGTKLKGSISSAGPFDANIVFPQGLSVMWSGKALGTIKLDTVKVIGDVGATLDLESNFVVADVEHLTAFTKVLLTEESFEWVISGENLTVNALGIDVSGVSLNSKTVTLKGFNGLKDGVEIKTFDLPSNDPAGGIHLTLEASTTNPSQVGVQLSSIGFETFVGDIMIAPVLSSGGVTLSPGSTSPLSLVGRLVPQDSAAGLSSVSDVFNNFVHGKDSEVVVVGASAGPSDVTWLNEGIKALRIATVLPNRGNLNIIKSINLNQLELLFTESTAFSPSTSSKSTDAAFTLPFAFPIDISALEQTITVGFEGTSFAQLAIPKSPSQTDVDNRIIHLTFDHVPFAVFGDKHSNFDQFVAATTVGQKQILSLSGAANADAKTAVGLLSLKDIGFSVGSSIAGLQGLNTRPVTVSNLDVNHGFPDFLLIKVDSSLFNPSNLTIGTGDVSFGLQFQNQDIGTADISNLIITPGNASYPIDVHFAPQGAAVSAGRTLLQNFLQGVDVDTTIAGNTDSTPIESLTSALSQIRLTPVTIPALHQTLIKSTALIFPVDIVQREIASATFTLANPFTASINLLMIGATATFHNLTLGTIDDVDISSNPIHADGHSSVTSPPLPLHFNLDPLVIIQLLTITASENGVNLGPLSQLFQIVLNNPDFHPPITSTVDAQPATCVSGQQFDVDGAILKSLAGLKIDLAVQSSVKLDDFATDLAFDQKGVPAVTDKTSLFLIGAVAAPITQRLVDGSTLAFNEANITNISNDGFDLSLAGSLTNIGPLDALITFLEPLTVTWEGHDIAKITLPPVCAAANAGVPNYRTNAHLTITNLDQFTAFGILLLHSPSFEWTITSSKLRVSALGTIFDNVSLSKKITFKAFNGLPGVTISNFQLPSDDSAGGIHIETDALIPSSAQLGIDLGTVGFQSFFQDTLVGPLSGTGLFLAPNAETRTHLSGRIVPQSGKDLENMGILFSNFLAGKNQTLTTKGDFVQPSGSSQPVSWLSTAFKSLTLNVILPGQRFDLIQSIDLNDLSVTIQNQDEAFAPPAGSNFTLAKYKNPFGFSLQVIDAGQTLVLSSQGIDTAQLVLPKVPAVGGISTGNVADLVISFHNEPLRSLNNAAFQTLFADVTLKKEVDIGLKGTADVTGRTSIGDVAISGIPFNVQSSLTGINAFGAVASLSNISVTGSGGVGGAEFIVSPLTTTLQNPSNITLDTVDIALPVIFNGVKIGRAAINPFDLIPGENVVGAEFHYEPDNANDTVAQSFLTQFIQSNNTLALNIEGDAASTPFGSLQPALSGLHLAAQLTALNQPNIITHVTVTITLESLDNNLVSVNFDVFNPLGADLILEFVQSDSGVNGEVFAQFGQAFENFVVPPGQTVNSGDFPNVLLTQGAIASLDIIPLGILDVFSASTVRVGQGGYQIPWLKLAQSSVPTTYNLALGFAAAAKLKHNNTLVNSTESKNSSGIVSTSDVISHHLSSLVSASATVTSHAQESPPNVSTRPASPNPTEAPPKSAQAAHDSPITESTATNAASTSPTIVSTTAKLATAAVSPPNADPTTTTVLSQSSTSS